MGPPPYGRTQSQPYQKPLALLERRMERKYSPDSVPAASQSRSLGLCPPDFSGLDNTFEVGIKRNSLGLGFSVCGGPDAPSPWTNLIRIKKVFPLQPAWETGKLKVGDVILKVSGIPLSSLSLRQALDILRSSPPTTVLQVCRVPDSSNLWNSQSPPKSRSSVVRSYSYGPLPSSPTLSHAPSTFLWTSYQSPHLSTSTSSPPGGTGDEMEIEISPATPEREWSPWEEREANTLDLLKPVELALQNSNNNSNNSNSSNRVVGEFSIVLKKVKGSLGFTLTSSNQTILNHTVKALVKEPAVSDGRIQPGDKLLAANGVDLADYSHQELICFLRQCPEEVTLRLYRDVSGSQTPLTPEGGGEGFPAYSHNRVSQSPSRKHLRYEAKELVRSLQSSRTSLEKAGLAGSTPGSYSSGGTLGRRLGRPFSPATAKRERNHSTGNKERNPVPVFCPASPVPQIESPATPLNSSAPPTLGMQVAQAFGKLQIEERLRIEELDSSPTINYSSSPGGDIGYSHSPQSPPAAAAASGSYNCHSPAAASGSYSPQVTSLPDSPVREVGGRGGSPEKSLSLPRQYQIQSYFHADNCSPKASRPNQLNLCSETNKKPGYIFTSAIDNSSNNNTDF